jgi:hypothetical protein
MYEWRLEGLFSASSLAAKCEGLPDGDDVDLVLGNVNVWWEQKSEGW